MKASLVAWGIVLLIAFAGAHWLLANGIGAAALWIGVAIVTLIMNWVVGRSFKKKMNAEVWMALAVFGFITTLAVAFQFVPVSMAVLMSLWLLLTGAALFAGSHKGGEALSLFAGLVMIVAALIVPAFGDGYFLAGAVFMGFLGVVHGYFFRE